MKLKQCLCVFLSLLFAVSLAGCREKTDPIYEQTIQYNLVSEPSSLDPQIARRPVGPNRNHEPV